MKGIPYFIFTCFIFNDFNLLISCNVKPGKFLLKINFLFLQTFSVSQSPSVTFDNGIVLFMKFFSKIFMKWYKKGYNANNATKINNKENVISKKNEITNKSKDKYNKIKYFLLKFFNE